MNNTIETIHNEEVEYGQRVSALVKVDCFDELERYMKLAADNSINPWVDVYTNNGKYYRGYPIICGDNCKGNFLLLEYFRGKKQCIELFKDINNCTVRVLVDINSAWLSIYDEVCEILDEEMDYNYVKYSDIDVYGWRKTLTEDSEYSIWHD